MDIKGSQMFLLWVCFLFLTNVTEAQCILDKSHSPLPELKKRIWVGCRGFPAKPQNLSKIGSTPLTPELGAQKERLTPTSSLDCKYEESSAVTSNFGCLPSVCGHLCDRMHNNGTGLSFTSQELGTVDEAFKRKLLGTAASLCTLQGYYFRMCEEGRGKLIFWDPRPQSENWTVSQSFAPTFGGFFKRVTQLPNTHTILNIIIHSIAFQALDYCQ